MKGETMILREQLYSGCCGATALTYAFELLGKTVPDATVIGPTKIDLNVCLHGLSSSQLCQKAHQFGFTGTIRSATDFSTAWFLLNSYLSRGIPCILLVCVDQPGDHWVTTTLVSNAPGTDNLCVIDPSKDNATGIYSSDKLRDFWQPYQYPGTKNQKHWFVAIESKQFKEIKFPTLDEIESSRNEGQFR
jgi:hypothetical protein